MPQAPIPTREELSGLVMAYRPEGMIADIVAPRFRVPSATTSYIKHTLGENFRNQDTQVGRKGKVKRLEFTGTKVPLVVNDHGLEDFVPMNDIEEAAQGVNPINDSAESLKDVMDLSREVRTAELFNDESNYSSANIVTLTSGDQFADTTATPITMIRAKLKDMLKRPNIAIFSPTTFEALATNKSVVSAALGNDGTSGVATKERIAQLLEVKEILIGEAYVNSAKEGSDEVTMEAAWGDNVIFAYIEQNPRGGKATFAMSPSLGNPEADTWFDKAAGGRKGGHNVKTTDQVSEVVACSELGLMIKNAV